MHRDSLGRLRPIISLEDMEAIPLQVSGHADQNLSSRRPTRTLIAIQNT